VSTLVALKCSVLTQSGGRAKHAVWKLEVDRPLRLDEVGVGLESGHDLWLYGKRDTTREAYARYIFDMIYITTSNTK